MNDTELDNLIETLSGIRAGKPWQYLSCGDVPPGSVFKRVEYAETATWTAPIYVLETCVEFHDSSKVFQVTYQELAAEWLIKRPGQDWQPCWKEVAP
jgi:hypothetical protein